MSPVFLLLGTNLGDKLKNLEVASDSLSQHMKILKKSAVYETEAWGKREQPSFFNQILEISTSLPPDALMKQLLETEKEMGRVRIEKWGERLIDIDLLYYQDLIFESEDLTIPHPEIPNRRFTLIPMVELSPDFLHPKLKTSQTELLEQCPDDLAVNLVQWK